jgi:UDP-N-acetylmuramoyl-tripeptide--D-alanyl-D-alanine ligase
VLGEMLELGSEHDDGHRRVGATAAELADLLLVVGDGAAAIAEGARSVGMPDTAIATVLDRATARDRLVAELRDGDVVLVKASRGIALDALVDDLRTALTAKAAAGR